MGLAALVAILFVQLYLVVTFALFLLEYNSSAESFEILYCLWMCLVEEFDFLIYDFDMFLDLSVPCSEGCFRNMYGKDDIIVLMIRGQY